MFLSFFPRPKWFFWSAALWTALVMAVWYAGGKHLGSYIGLSEPKPGTPSIIGISALWAPQLLWFYIYYIGCVAIFTVAWQALAPHPWWRWSILGSATILLATYIQVEILVVLNDWYGPFYDLVQAALGHTKVISPREYYGLLATVTGILLSYVIIYTLTAFFTSHYVFRWRTAMNNYYMENWPRLRLIEGAAQRVQEDTMNFAKTTEDMGGTFINSFMTLIAFMPVLVKLGVKVSTLPIIGAVPHALVWAAVLWSAFGTLFLALIGIKLPGLQFRNQRVEAALRKELVYGEDDENRAKPPTINELFSNVRKNYFKLYFNYMYFNVGRIIYLQTDNIFPYIILGPTIISGVITLGLMQQILSAFDQVRGSFQYLVNSWPTIVDLQSIYKRLRAFEAVLQDEPLSKIEFEKHAT